MAFNVFEEENAGKIFDKFLFEKQNSGETAKSTVDRHFEVMT